MKAAFTPGPWSVDYSHVCDEISGAQDKFIAQTTRCNEDKKDERHANARLIAAAPCLLEACKLFLAYHDGVDKYDVSMMLAYADAEKAIRAAIAKAEGGEA